VGRRGDGRDEEEDGQEAADQRRPAGLSAGIVLHDEAPGVGVTDRKSQM
jgi:hypothetical protein